MDKESLSFNIKIIDWPNTLEMLKQIEQLQNELLEVKANNDYLQEINAEWIDCEEGGEKYSDDEGENKWFQYVARTKGVRRFPNPEPAKKS